MLIKKCNKVFDVSEMLNELQELELFNSWGSITDTSFTFAITSRDGTTTDGAKAFIGDESEFKLLSIFRGTYTEEVLNNLNIEYGRVRFIKMLPGHIMKIHKDPGIRYHIPLTTNQYCGFLNDNLKTYTMPDIGRLYQLNGQEMHAAFNCSRRDERIHLVIVKNYSIKDLSLGHYSE